MGKSCCIFILLLLHIFDAVDILFSGAFLRNDELPNRVRYISIKIIFQSTRYTRTHTHTRIRCTPTLCHLINQYRTLSDAEEEEDRASDRAPPNKFKLFFSLPLSLSLCHLNEKDLSHAGHNRHTHTHSTFRRTQIARQCVCASTEKVSKESVWKEAHA